MLGYNHTEPNNNHVIIAETIGFCNLFCVQMNNSVNLSPSMLNSMLTEALEEAQRRFDAQRLQYSQYHADPIGFGNKVLGQKYTSDVENLMRSVVENPITVAKSANATGKSHSAAALAVWFYTVFPTAKVFVTSAPPLENLQNILWGEIMTLVNRRRKLFEESKIKTLKIYRKPPGGNSDVEEEDAAQSFIAGVTIPQTGTADERKAKFSGKHAPYLLFIVDEGDAVPDDIYEGIESCMSGGFARLLVLFNPRAQRGPVFEMENTNRARVVQLSAFNHPNVIQGKDVIPGAVTRETVVRRINEWTRPAVEGETPSEEESFDVPPYLIGCSAKSLQGLAYPPLPSGKRVITDNAFSYMVLGRYPKQGVNQLISLESINAARKRYDAWVAEHGEVPPSIAPKLGLDVAEYGPDFNVPIIRYGGYVERVERIWQGVDPIMTADYAVAICRRKNITSAVIDGTGVGSAVAPYMARQQKGLRTVSAKFSAKPAPFIKTHLGEFFQLRDQLWWACREWLRTDPNAMLPPEPMLLEELLLPTYEVRDGRIFVMDKQTMRQKLGRSPNYADALVLTFVPAEKAKVVRLTD